MQFILHYTYTTICRRVIWFCRHFEWQDWMNDSRSGVTTLTPLYAGEAYKFCWDFKILLRSILHIRLGRTVYFTSRVFPWNPSIFTHFKIRFIFVAASSFRLIAFCRKHQHGVNIFQSCSLFFSNGAIFLQRTSLSERVLRERSRFLLFIFIFLFHGLFFMIPSIIRNENVTQCWRSISCDRFMSRLSSLRQDVTKPLGLSLGMGKNTFFFSNPV